MNWLKRIFSRKSEKGIKPVSFSIVQPQFEQWDASDVAMFRAFLKTPTGIKLISICGSETFQQAMKEANGDALNRAAGMDFMLRFQFNLASDKMLAEISSALLDKVQITDNAEQDADIASETLRSF